MMNKLGQTMKPIAVSQAEVYMISFFLQLGLRVLIVLRELLDRSCRLRSSADQVLVIKKPLV